MNEPATPTGKGQLKMSGLVMRLVNGALFNMKNMMSVCKYCTTVRRRIKGADRRLYSINPQAACMVVRRRRLTTIHLSQQKFSLLLHSNYVNSADLKPNKRAQHTDLFNTVKCA